MTPVQLTLDKNILRSQVATNLNIPETEIGGYLHTLIDGMADVTKISFDGANKALSSLHVDTADEEALDRYGAIMGIPRLKKRFSLTKNTNNHISLSPTLFTPNSSIVLPLFKKGDVLEVDLLRITFLEDVLYNSAKSKVYISGEVRAIEGRVISTSYLSKGTTFPVEVPNQHKHLISSLSLNIEESLGFSDFEEDVSNYRTRLKAAITAKNISNVSAVDKAISTVPGIYRYYIDKSEYPNVVYYMTTGDYWDTGYNAELYQSMETLLKHNLESVRSYSSNFVLRAPEIVEFSINVRTAEDSKLIETLSNLPAHFLNTHRLGTPLTLNHTYVENYLRGAYPEFIQPFSVEFYYTSEGTDVPVGKDKSILVIQPNQIPRLNTIHLNRY